VICRKAKRRPAAALKFLFLLQYNNALLLLYVKQKRIISVVHRNHWVSGGSIVYSHSIGGSGQQTALYQGFMFIVEAM